MKNVDDLWCQCQEDLTIYEHLCHMLGTPQAENDMGLPCKELQASGEGEHAGPSPRLTVGLTPHWLTCQLSTEHPVCVRHGDRLGTQTGKRSRAPPTPPAPRMHCSARPRLRIRTAQGSCFQHTVPDPLCVGPWHLFTFGGKKCPDLYC